MALPLPVEDDSSRKLSCGRCRCSIGTWLRLPPVVQDRLSALTNSRVWRILLIILTVILLFGAQLRELCFPKEADIAFDVLFIITFSIFMLDIIFKCYTEPQYSEISFCGNTQSQITVCGCRGLCNLGSFIFWCGESKINIQYKVTLRLSSTIILTDTRLHFNLHAAL